MNNHLIMLLLLAAVPSLAQNVYKCVDEDGNTKYSDKPCSNTGKNQEVLTGYTAPSEPPPVAEGGAETGYHQLIIGRWKWNGGDEVRTFHSDGSFTSTSKDEFARTNGRGEWEINDDQLTITARFDNILSDGNTVSVSNVLKVTIKSMTNDAMVTYWDRHDYTSEWSKL